jgi:hypothetical protein
MHDGTGNDLAERGTSADRRADGPEGEIKATRAPREVGNHQDRDHAKDSRPHAIQDLDCDQRARVGGEGVENGANRQDPERQEQQRLSAPGPRFSARPGRKQRDDKLRGHHARRHEHHRTSTLPLGQHLAQERQHRGVGKVKHHRTDEKNE